MGRRISMEMLLFGCYNVFKDNLWQVNGLWLMEDDLCLFQILSVNQMNMIKSLHLEEKRPKSWLKSVSAFANGKGGVLFQC